jgi:hypothetical protein
VSAPELTMESGLFSTGARRNTAGIEAAKVIR